MKFTTNTPKAFANLSPVVGALGTIVAFALTRTISSLLLGISPTDPSTFITIPLFLLGVALLSSYTPAWKATKIDPVMALRTE